MHWPSHCDAYYATWIIRYLEPRRAPWKSIMSWFVRDTETRSSSHPRRSGTDTTLSPQAHDTSEDALYPSTA